MPQKTQFYYIWFKSMKEKRDNKNKTPHNHDVIAFDKSKTY